MGCFLCTFQHHSVKCNILEPFSRGSIGPFTTRKWDRLDLETKPFTAWLAVQRELSRLHRTVSCTSSWSCPFLFKCTLPKMWKWCGGLCKLHCRFAELFYLALFLPNFSGRKTADMLFRVATCQGNVREKQNFPPGQGNVREFWKNVRELWPFEPCHGIVREFCDVMSGNCQGILSWHYF